MSLFCSSRDLHGRSCRFCEIAGGPEQAETVYADGAVVAFLDHRPIFRGHTLVCPRRHVETLPDLPDDLLGPFFTAVRLLSRAVPVALDARGTFVAMNNRVSQSVPHLHAHVVPRKPKDGLRGFFWPRMRYPSEGDRAAVGAAIRDAIAELEA